MIHDITIFSAEVMLTIYNNSISSTLKGGDIMKKFFAVAALILGVVVSQIVVPSQAQAAPEEYLGEWEGGWKAYWIVKSTKLERGDPSNFVNSCQVKAVSPKGTVKYIDYVMQIQPQLKDDDFLVSFRDSLGGNGTFYMSNPGVYLVERKLARWFIIGMAEAMNNR